MKTGVASYNRKLIGPDSAGEGLAIRFQLAILEHMTITEQMPTSTEAVSNDLLVKIAKLYYLDNLTQLQISRRLGLSRQKVQRLIQTAQGKGDRADHHSAGVEHVGGS